MQVQQEQCKAKCLSAPRGNKAKCLAPPAAETPVNPSSSRNSEPHLTNAQVRVLAEMYRRRKSHYGREVIFDSRLALALGAGCSEKTVTRARELFVRMRLFKLERAGGGKKGGVIGITSIYRIKSLRRIRRLLPGHSAKNVPVGRSQNDKTCFDSVEPKTNARARENARTSTANQSAPDTGPRRYTEPIALDDPGLKAFLKSVQAFLAGTTSDEVAKAVFQASRRRGITPAALVAPWYAYTSHQDRRGLMIKRPDLWVRAAYDLREWPDIAPGRAPGGAVPTFSDAGAWPGEGMDAYRERRALQADRARQAAQAEPAPAPVLEVAAVLADVVRHVEPPQRRVIRPAKPEPPPPRPKPAPTKSREEYIADAVARGFTRDVAETCWRNNFEENTS